MMPLELKLLGWSVVLLLLHGQAAERRYSMEEWCRLWTGIVLIVE